MIRPSKRQGGAYLVMVTFLLAMMLGLSGLVIDTARVLVLKSEMQNAIDAASLAAAKELDGDTDATTGAIARAMDAAQEALDHSSHFARIKNLLGTGEISLVKVRRSDAGGGDASFEFYSCIGSHFDSDDCTGKELAAGNGSDAIYVEVFFDSSISSIEDYFTVDLLFIPILSLLSSDDGAGGSTISAIDNVSLSVDALAGKSFFTCEFPPMVMCDPFDDGTASEGETFKDRYVLGGDMQLKQQGSNQWANGNFGFLVPITGQNGATAVSEAIADEGVVGCSPAIVTTSPGGMTQKTKAAINTRFGDYTSPAPFNQSDASDLWPPDDNVIDYPADTGTYGPAGDSRFGNGVWDIASYWAANHGGHAGHSGGPPAALTSIGEGPGGQPTRYQVHQWEVANSDIPEAPTEGVATAGRRVLHVAVISCDTEGISGGKTTAAISNPDGFAKIFLTRRASGPPSAEIWGEYAGWVDESEDNYHVEVQLYE